MNHDPEVIKFVFDVLTTLFVGFSFLIISIASGYFF